MKWFLFGAFALALTAFPALAEKQPIARYQSIIDRQMFGPLPPGFDPKKLPSEVQRSSQSEKELTKEQEQLKSAIHFSVLNVTSDGQPEVGFTDNSDPKVPRHYFLKIGETSKDGKWAVRNADAEQATMTIAQGDVEVTLSLGGNSATDGGTAKAGGAAVATANAGARRTGLLGGGLGGSLRARRLQRRQEQQAAEAAKEAERQAKEAEETQRREAERAEQRQQLLAIQEELKKVREAKAAAARNDSESDGDANNEAE